MGGTVACYLAAAGVGRLILAHAGNICPADLNRQILMSTPALGKPRVTTAEERLRALNPHVELVPIAANITPELAAELVPQADLVVSAAPLFEERLALNAAAVHADRPLIDAAMFNFTAQLLTVFPGETACLACLWPESPAHWRRQFPVLGAVSGTIAAMAAVDAVKVITGIDVPTRGQLLNLDCLTWQLDRFSLVRNDRCPVCGPDVSRKSD